MRRGGGTDFGYLDLVGCGGFEGTSGAECHRGCLWGLPEEFLLLVGFIAGRVICSGGLNYCSIVGLLWSELV